MRVLKFGGSSMANSACFFRVANILENNTQYGQIASVLSAPENVTNYLTTIIQKTIADKNVISHVRETEYIFIELLQGLADRQPGFDYHKQKIVVEHEFYQLKQELHGIKLIGQCSDLVNATIISRGEKLSTNIMAYLLQVRGNKVSIIDPTKTLLAVGHYLESTVDIAESRRRMAANEIPSDHIILMAGFIACNEKGELIVLGRHGSDYSATVLAACLHADCCEIWTNVDGIYTCDPRQVPEAQLLKSISYQEVMELSYFGANILHPRTIAPIVQFKIPCFIKNTANPHAVGTLISSKSEYNVNPVKCITNLNDMVMFNISAPGIKDMVDMTSRLFAALSFTGISVVLINQSLSENSISFCVSQKEHLLTLHILEEEFYSELNTGLLNPFNKIGQLAIISLIGDGIRAIDGISAKLFLALARANISIVSIVQGSCKCSISVVVRNNDIISNMQILHKMLFTIDRIVEVFVIGVGGVGGTLLDQINRQQVCLKQKHIDLRVCGIANSRILVTNINGIELSNWQDKLNVAKKFFNINKLIYLLKTYQLINPVIIDCTSSQEIANRYSDFLENGFHVITSNKKANTSSWKYYQQIRISVAKYRRKFLYDTNVGAGLPVIENLQNLLNAGDKLIKFFGILSGSLSFIFGKLEEGVSLSKATAMARSLGFTEPNPRDDLSGIDVARKLLILAREAGYQLELSDIKIESLLPAKLMAITDIEYFMQNLSKFDSIFATRAAKAHAEGKVLRYIGMIEENGRCIVKINAVDSNNPLYKVKNGENALIFYSRYYKPIPLVLRGYGAGNNVTAAGIFADLLRTL